MGHPTKPLNPRAFRQPIYTLTPVDEVRLLAEGLPADAVDAIRRQLREGWPFSYKCPRQRMEVYIGPNGVQITKY